MDRDYITTIKEKKEEAGRLMSKKQVNLCNGIIHTAAIASGVVAFIPVPVADAIPISAAQITMVVSLGGVFKQKLSRAAAKAIVAAAASTFAGRTLVKLIPGVGWAISSAVAAGVTEAIGWMVAVDMANDFYKNKKLKAVEKENAENEMELRYYKQNKDVSTVKAEDLFANENDDNNYGNEAGSKTVMMPIASKYYVGKKYGLVVQRFHKLGFVDVRSEEIRDIQKENDKKLGTVSMITIARNPNFKKGDVKSIKDPVVVFYHAMN